MTHAFCEDIFQAPDAWLEFNLQLDTESGFDQIAFYYSDPNGSNLWGWRYWGMTSSWFHVSLNMRQWVCAGRSDTEFMQPAPHHLQQ